MYQCSRTASTVGLRRPAMVKPKAPLSRARSVTVHANTLWTLAPRESKAQFFSTPRNVIDLTGIIGARRVCSVGARDYASKANEPVDLTVVDHGGVHLLFEAEGCASPVDSPSVLYITDIDSDCDIILDGKVLDKGKRTKCKPGATIDMGEEASYVVLRNVFAHA